MHSGLEEGRMRVETAVNATAKEVIRDILNFSLRYVGTVTEIRIGHKQD